MKVDNITINSEHSFTGYKGSEVIHGVRIESSAELPVGVTFPSGFEVSFQMLKNDGQDTLIEGVYLIVSYASDSDDSNELEFFFQNFFAGFLRPVSSSELDGIIRVLKRFASKKKDLTGLIGELIFIHSLSDPSEGVLAWHISKNSIFDFNFSHGVYEVKCTSSSLRKHNLNHHQLRSLIEIGDSSNYISVIINRNLPTNSLQDLVHRIHTHLDQDVKKIFKSKLDQYSDLLNSRIKFDIESTVRSIEVFSANKFIDLVSHNSIIDARDLSYSVDFNKLVK